MQHACHSLLLPCYGLDVYNEVYFKPKVCKCHLVGLKQAFITQCCNGTVCNRQNRNHCPHSNFAESILFPNVCRLCTQTASVSRSHADNTLLITLAYIQNQCTGFYINHCFFLFSGAPLEQSGCRSSALFHRSSRIPRLSLMKGVLDDPGDYTRLFLESFIKKIHTQFHTYMLAFASTFHTVSDFLSNV